LTDLALEGAASRQLLEQVEESVQELQWARFVFILELQSSKFLHCFLPLEKKEEQFALVVPFELVVWVLQGPELEKELEQRHFA